MTFFQKVHFIQKCSVTQNTIFQCIKNIFLVVQFKVSIFHRIQPNDDPSWLLTSPDTKTMEQPGTRLCGEEWPKYSSMLCTSYCYKQGTWGYFTIGSLDVEYHVFWVTMNDWTHAGNFFAINEVIDMKWFIPILDQHSMLMLFIIKTKTQLQGMGRDVPLIALNIEYSWSNKF